jgi:hypothetical protein
MKKIMFSTIFGLQQGVIAGTKTMTRRVDKKLNHPLVTDISEWGIDDKGKCYLVITYSTGLTEDVYPPYQIGEEIAIAQPYKTLIEQGYLCRESDGWVNEKYIVSAGYQNKMFVAAEYMPHRIRITDIKVERLQDISEEDAMKEGVEKWMDGYIVTGIMERHGQNNAWFKSPRDAFFRLFTKLCGYKAWNSNPWVFAYTFELVR